MAKYSFKEECDNLDKLAREMRENLQKVNIGKSYETIWEIAALAERMKRKICKYSDFLDWATSVATAECSIQKPLDENCGR